MDQNQRREYLFQRDLEMEKQMEKVIKDAQPKPKQDFSKNETAPSPFPEQIPQVEIATQ